MREARGKTKRDQAKEGVFLAVSEANGNPSAKRAPVGTDLQ